jgi:hypothetical protein
VRRETAHATPALPASPPIVRTRSSAAARACPRDPTGVTHPLTCPDGALTSPPHTHALPNAAPELHALLKI